MGIDRLHNCSFLVALEFEFPPQRGTQGFIPAMYERKDPLLADIRALEPQTVAGLAVKARAMSLEHYTLWEGGDPSVIDPDNSRPFLDSVCAFAGVKPSTRRAASVAASRRGAGCDAGPRALARPLRGATSAGPAIFRQVPQQRADESCGPRAQRRG